MQINITARHFKLSEKMKKYTEKEVLRLKKYYDGIIDTEIILSWEKKYRMAEIKIAVYGTILTAHERSEDMYSSINGAIDKLERRLIKYKEHLKKFDHKTVSKEEMQVKNEEILKSKEV